MPRIKELLKGLLQIFQVTTISFCLFFLNCNPTDSTAGLVVEQGVVKIKQDYPYAVFTLLVKLTYFKSTPRACSMTTKIA